MDIVHLVRCSCNFMPQCCVCGSIEKVLRGYSGDEHGKMRLMSPAERAFCIEEADWAGEGNYDRVWLAGLSDRDLAHTVLTAWKEYVDDHF